MAWNASFNRVEKNKNAIAERGWGPLNRNLLLYKEIQHTMTREDFKNLESMKRTFQQPNMYKNFVTPFETISFLSRLSDSTTTISDLTDQDQMLYPKYHSLNYSSRNSAMVLETLVGAHDLNEARERNRLNKSKGSAAAETYKTAKAVTAMFHFNEYGCKIGKTALDKKNDLYQPHLQKVKAARKKEEDAYNEKKRKYDDVMNLNISDNKLTGAQLRSLLNMKKRKTDKTISTLKKKEMFVLWQEWKARPVEPLEYHNELIQSVNEAAVDCMVNDDASNQYNKKDQMASV